MTKVVFWFILMFQIFLVGTLYLLMGGNVWSKELRLGGLRTV